MPGIVVGQPPTLLKETQVRMNLVSKANLRLLMIQMRSLKKNGIYTKIINRS